MELSFLTILLIASLIFIVAGLYSSVGHGGASGYLAVLSLFAFAPPLMSTTALILNVLVAGVGTIHFMRAGHFSVSKAWPFVLLSMPAAFLGGYLRVSEKAYFLLLAGVLLFAAYRMFLSARGTAADESAGNPSLPVALAGGAGIGFLSGIVGVGGGIFLSPVMIFLRWATTKQAAAISAFFIVVNSLAGLGGRAIRGGLELGTIWPFVVSAFLGGFLGSYMGSHRLSGALLRRLLALVLLMAALKLVFISV
jgi:hypothetical protein